MYFKMFCKDYCHENSTSFSLSVYTLRIMYIASDTRDLTSDKIEMGIESLFKVCLSLRGS